MSGPPIEQETFDLMVQENIEDLDMEPEEAVQDAIETLTSQKANLLYSMVENDGDPLFPLIVLSGRFSFTPTVILERAICDQRETRRR